MSKIPGRHTGIPQSGQGAIPRAGTSGLQQPSTSHRSGIPTGGAPGVGIPQRRGIPTATFGTAKITVAEEPARPKTAASSGKKKKNESLLQWFDKNVEKTLQSHRTRSIKQPMQLGQSRGLRHPLVLSSSASGIDLSNRLRTVQHTDLAEAVEKLATAEAMCAFEGAVIAAEQAASQAPPELAEEAAAAGARGYQSQITSVVKEIIPGVKPIEVVGYVGITRPKRQLGSHV